MKKQKTIYGWHFIGKTLRDGTPIPPDGVWLPRIANPIPCERGYHGSAHPLDALKYAPGSTLCYDEYRGKIIEHGDPVDKFVGEQRRILRRMDATELLRYFARMQAVSVAHLWDAPDVVLDYLMTGDESLRAVNAAATATWNAGAATWNAAAAAGAWNGGGAREEFQALVNECMEVKP